MPRAVFIPAALLWAVFAPMAFAAEGEPAMMRTCVETYDGDPDVTVPLGAFCSCYVAEILRDAEANPDLYGKSNPSDDADNNETRSNVEKEERTPKKLYYSSKEESDRMSAVVSTMAGHESYCVKLLTE
jgi:hypothetical protein